MSKVGDGKACNTSGQGRVEKRNGVLESKGLDISREGVAMERLSLLAEAQKGLMSLIDGGDDCRGEVIFCSTFGCVYVFGRGRLGQLDAHGGLHICQGLRKWSE